MGKQFGGSGGSKEPIPFEAYAEDEFAQALNKRLGDWIRQYRSNAYNMWSALANVTWRRGEDTASYSFRAAGDLIASICNDGTTYIDYYCVNTDGEVYGYIAQELAEEGWTFEYDF